MRCCSHEEKIITSISSDVASRHIRVMTSNIDPSAYTPTTPQNSEHLDFAAISQVLRVMT
jgi:hypothetical protein